MRIGLLFRADTRGLSTQTQETLRHLPIDKTLGIEMGDFSPYEERWSRYPEMPRVSYDGHHLRPWETVESFLADLDVVLTFETFYDDDLVTRARERGVKTACVANWEFFRWEMDPWLPRPDLFIAPSTWHLSSWPENTVHVPFPVARDRLPFELRTKAETFLHVAGHPATGDRNGTQLLRQALRHVRSEISLIIRAQGPARTAERAVPRNVHLEVIREDIDDYWELYERGDVLLAPRRYGGLSLPMNEALARGMPVVSLDVEPQRSFLPAASLVSPHRERPLKCQAGFVERWTATAQGIASKIEELARDDALVEDLSRKADAHADSISWEALAPRFLSVLSELCAVNA